ncbi:MAG: hypothetical protein HY428_00300 [Candidatus Levybacteria bacterium]|nr:hypothetical protein [Candidatus Levybacteria bacterium]
MYSLFQNVSTSTLEQISMILTLIAAVLVFFVFPKIMRDLHRDLMKKK